MAAGKKKGKKKAAARMPAPPRRGAPASERRGRQAAESFPVVGIGASAGGLDAFKKFFAAMPAESDMAFVLVPHLDPTHKSLMVELLAKQTTLRVCEAGEGMPLEPNHVYIIPPNRYLSISHGTLRLIAPKGRRGMETAIDFFLRALAADRGELAIGIILSGTGTHGTQGLKEIKLAGGMVIAQQPESAEYDQMPYSAIRTGMVDYVLPPEQMPAALIDYVRHASLTRLQPPPAADEAADQLIRVLAALKLRTKYDFRFYRKSTLLRRVHRRMGLCHIDGLTEYVKYLREQPDEVMALYKDLLIGVTGFFRDSDAFDVLAQRVIPELVDRQSGERHVRVWVPGCATGEEAYSIAILLNERFAVANKPSRIQVFATDIDEESLDMARQGIYPETIAGDVSAERLERFFTRPDEHHFQVNKQVREAVVFAPQNVISDAPFSKLDMISCRNLLIYLEPEIQQKVVSLFHFALKEDGYLLLGPSETIGRDVDLFESVSKKWRIFRRIGPTRPDLVEIPVVSDRQRRARSSAGDTALRSPLSFAELTQKLLLSEFAPAALLINRKYEILYFFGPTSKFLELPTGEPTSDLTVMARQGLVARIRSACHKAIHDNGPVVDTDAKVLRQDGYVPCTITVKPLLEPKEAEGLMLLTFVDQAGSTPLPERAAFDAESSAVRQLEYELKATREDLQATIEELESSNEELKASNEESMSMNEELQSANEELETSKEELQSLNEELSTVNNQLQDKVEALEGLNNDITNLLNSTDVAIVFLDDELRIRRFTPGAGKLLNLIASDVGRPISTFATRFTGDDLVRDARQVLDKLQSLEREIITDRRTCHLRRMLPYRTADNRIQGVVVTFLDITERKRIEDELRRLNAELEKSVDERTAELRRSEARIRAMINTAADAIFTADHAGMIQSFNPAAERMFGYPESQALGKNVGLLMPSPFKDQRDGDLARYLEAGEGKPIGGGREVVGCRQDGTLFPAELSISSFRDGTQQFFTGILRDVSERNALKEELLTIAAEEQRRIGQDLHDHVGQQLTGLALLAKTLADDVVKDSPANADAARRLAEGLKQALQQVRPLARGLIPVDISSQGLMTALAEFAETTTRDSGTQCTFVCETPVHVDNNEIATHLFRIAQEAVTNALKHAEPRNIEIALASSEGQTRLTVRDDGKGLPTAAGRSAGLGLRIMEYRASLIGANLTIATPPEGGTAVSCILARNSIHDQA